MEEDLSVLEGLILDGQEWQDGLAGWRTSVEGANWQLVKHVC